jgi:hypothetical protein
MCRASGERSQAELSLAEALCLCVHQVRHMHARCSRRPFDNTRYCVQPISPVQSCRFSCRSFSSAAGIVLVLVLRSSPSSLAPVALPNHSEHHQLTARGSLTFSDCTPTPTSTEERISAHSPLRHPRRLAFTHHLSLVSRSSHFPQFNFVCGVHQHCNAPLEHSTAISRLRHSL